jgi:hypothetical protein
MSSKSFGGEDFGLGLSAEKSPVPPTQPPATKNKVKKAMPAHKPPTKPPAETSGYKRNSFKNGGRQKLAAFLVDEANALKFKILCTEQNTSASAVINDFISDYLKANGGE